MLAFAGLATNSSVVVVASMLVSPIMGPILAITFGTVVDSPKLVRLGLRTEVGLGGLNGERKSEGEVERERQRERGRDGEGGRGRERDGERGRERKRDIDGERWREMERDGERWREMERERERALQVKKKGASSEPERRPFKTTSQLTLIHSTPNRPTGYLPRHLCRSWLHPRHHLWLVRREHLHGAGGDSLAHLRDVCQG